MVTWCRDSLGYGFISQNDGPAGFVYYSNITGVGFAPEESHRLSYHQATGAAGVTSPAPEPTRRSYEQS